MQRRNVPRVLVMPVALTVCVVVIATAGAVVGQDDDDPTASDERIIYWPPFTMRSATEYYDETGTRVIERNVRLFDADSAHAWRLYSVRREGQPDEERVL